MCVSCVQHVQSWFHNLKMAPITTWSAVAAAAGLIEVMLTGREHCLI